MPRLKLIKTQWTIKKCPLCGLKGGAMYCRRCHGPRREVDISNASKS